MIWPWRRSSWLAPRSPSTTPGCTSSSYTPLTPSSGACFRRPPPRSPGWRWRPDTGQSERGRRAARLLGVFPETKLSDHAVDLHPGDSIILYTDGVTEQAREGVQFGVERLQAALESSAGLDADGIADAIERAVVEFGQAEVRD